jgi:hypothetical protein
MKSERCPNCTGTKVIQADVGTLAEGRVHHHFIFPGLPSLQWDSSVGLPGEFHHCLSCGHLWSRLDPKKVVAYLRACGRELTRQYYEALLDGPYRDLPDFPEAREAADRVAEMDKLVIHGKSAEATRK